MIKIFIAGLIAVVIAVFAFFNIRVNPPGPVDPTATVQASSHPAKPASQTFTFTMADLEAFGLQDYTEVMDYENSYGTIEQRTYVGWRLKDVLGALGADLSALDGGSTLLAVAADDVEVTYGYGLIVSDVTLLAFINEKGAQLTVPRLCTGDNYIAGMWLKDVVSLTVNY